MSRIIVSACLLGENCKYNGGNNYHASLIDYLKEHEVFPVCPEMMGGLPTPRLPGEISNNKVFDRSGHCVDDEYRLGASKVLKLAQDIQADLCILQSRSPSCGVNQIYDGSFSGKKIAGMGVCASLLHENGFKVMDIEDLPSIYPYSCKHETTNGLDTLIP